MSLKFYSIDTRYIEYLSNDPKLKIVSQNKETRTGIRKYLGVVLSIGPYCYYVPLASLKSSDYTIKNNIKIIRKSIIPIMRIVVPGQNGKAELKGTLKFSNMIPVPNEAITYCDISAETDLGYKILMEKEYEFIKKNKKDILKNASILYNQKTKEKSLYGSINKKPKYLDNTLDFKYAEQKMKSYQNP